MDPSPSASRLRRSPRREGGRGVPLSHVYQILFEIDILLATMAKYPPPPPRPLTRVGIYAAGGVWSKTVKFKKNLKGGGG
jgi:hypothetical protein